MVTVQAERPVCRALVRVLVPHLVSSAQVLRFGGWTTRRCRRLANGNTGFCWAHAVKRVGEVDG
jgi:hypothetical protein